MIDWAKELFPICRSITGSGVRKTLEYFKKINPEFHQIRFKSGKKVFDWVIPLEWSIKDGFIKHLKTGKKYAQFKKNNLHVVNYSIPVNKLIATKKQLLKNIYVREDYPKAIPYVTSYYKPRWGFCMSSNTKKSLPNGKYKVFINSSLKKGHLDMIHAKIKGKSKKEIFFSSYVCHPSMANNELSGPVLLNAILLYLKNKYPKSNFSYRFVLLPETIGSIAYISKYKNLLKKNVIAGFNLTCVGDQREYSITHSRQGTTLADYVLLSALKNKKNLKRYSFLHRGSDERQYCAPGIDLPLATFSRSKPGSKNFKEYHTSEDNFNVVTKKGLDDSLKVMKNIIDTFESGYKELGIYPKYKYFCEPNLGKRNLYPTITPSSKYEKKIFIRKDLLQFSDGTRSIFDIALIIKQPLKQVLEEYKKLKKNGVIK